MTLYKKIKEALIARAKLGMGFLWRLYSAVALNLHAGSLSSHIFHLFLCSMQPEVFADLHNEKGKKRDFLSVLQYILFTLRDLDCFFFSFFSIVDNSRYNKSSEMFNLTSIF